MFNVAVNYENQKCVVLNFEEMIEFCSDLLESCEEKISLFKKEFPHLKDSIDEPQDYYYIITCDTEEEAEKVELYLEEAFSSLEEEVELELEECY